MNKKTIIVVLIVIFLTGFFAYRSVIACPCYGSTSCVGGCPWYGGTCVPVLTSLPVIKGPKGWFGYYGGGADHCGVCVKWEFPVAYCGGATASATCPE